MNFREVPNEQRSRRYGSYGLLGVDAIVVNPETRGIALQDALQVVTGNQSITATVFRGDRRHPNITECAGDRKLCYWVHSDGRLTTSLDGLVLE